MGLREDPEETAAGAAAARTAEAAAEVTAVAVARQEQGETAEASAFLTGSSLLGLSLNLTRGIT